MFRVFIRNLHQLRSIVNSTQTHKLPWFQLDPFSRYFRASKSVPRVEESHWFEADYLVQKCGFSLEKAVSVSKFLVFDNPKQLDSITLFLNSLKLSESQICTVLKRCPFLFRVDPKLSLIPNISLLRNMGVPEAKIELLFVNQPRLLVSTHDRFTSVVDKVKKLGIDPSKVAFLLAVHVLRAMTDVSWDRKVQIYKKWGLSDNEVMEAFCKQPWMMGASEEKIMKAMDFYINQMGFAPTTILYNPVIVTFSFEKRIRPRCIIYKTLLAKGLVKRHVSLGRILCISEEMFLERFVQRYKLHSAELFNLYNETLALKK